MTEWPEASESRTPPPVAPPLAADPAANPDLSRALHEAVRLAGIDPAHWPSAVETLGRTLMAAAVAGGAPPANGTPPPVSRP